MLQHDLYTLWEYREDDLPTLCTALSSCYASKTKPLTATAGAKKD